MFHEISSCFNVNSFTKNLACLRLKCYERYEREWDGERWSVYNCRPVEASVELTSPYTGKVVKVHHKAMGKLTILNTSNLLSKILKVHPEAESWKSKMGGWSQFWWHDSSWLHVFQRSVSGQEGKVGDGNLQPLTSWMTTEPSHACLDRCKTPSKSAPFSLMWRPETARRQHHHHPSHSLHQQLHHQHHQHLQHHQLHQHQPRSCNQCALHRCWIDEFIENGTRKKRCYIGKYYNVTLLYDSMWCYMFVFPYVSISFDIRCLSMSGCSWVQGRARCRC